MKLVVGLGNPGADYERTRHNIGWDVVTSLCNETPISKFNGLLVKKRNVWFFRPTTFMNLSGEAVASLVGMHKISVSDIIIVHDDMDIPLGNVRVKNTGGHGGHRGVKNIIERLGSSDFTRVKCGIGRPAEGVEVIQHVLTRFNIDETVNVSEMTSNAVAVILSMLPKNDPGSSCDEESNTS